MTTGTKKSNKQILSSGKWAKDLIKKLNYTLQTPGPTLKFLNGGKMNIIPTGALHKELHHLDEENITRKGIPVVTRGEGGELEQHAEIESGEWIANKEVTIALEQYRDLYNQSPELEAKDLAAIAAGELLVKEILSNTIDKGKVIKSTE